MTVLVVALQQILPACGTAVEAIMPTLPNPGSELRRLIGVLINGILDSRPDPPLALARLRMRGELAEYHLSDLLFTDIVYLYTLR